MRRARADQRRLLDRLGEVERRVLVEEAGVEIGVADHGDVAQPRRLAGIEPQPQPVGILDLALLLDERRLEPDRLERAAAEPAGSARGHSKNVISVPGLPTSSPK